jgi:copper oxidase (laccase) domain-containing protein
VPPERAQQVADAWPGAVATAAVVACPDGQPGIDVRQGVVARLLALGMARESITLVGGCTVEDPDLFSYRRDGVTGRQGVAVCRHGLARMDA